MRTPALFLIVVAVTLIAPASAQDSGDAPSKEKVQKSANNVKALQQERIATLKAMADLDMKLFQSGSGSFESALDARVRVFEAALDAAEKESDRITLYKNLVDVLKEYEKLAQQSVKTPQREAYVLEVKARRLEAQIHLGQAQANRPNQQHKKIVLTSPQEKDVTITRPYVCQLHAKQHIEVRSLVSGYLDEVPVKEGQAVKKGEVLFKIAPTLYAEKVRAQQAEVKLADLDLNNAKELLKRNAVSDDEVARLEAKLTVAQAKANEAKAELDFTTIRAPFDGVIDRVREQQGSLVAKPDVLTTLSDNTVMWAYFNMPEADYIEYREKLSKGKSSDLQLELKLADNSTFPQPGKIAAIEADFNNATGSVVFRADFPNPDGLLRHGMSGTVLIQETLNNAVVIPQRAVFEILGKRYVYVVDNQDVVHLREIVVQRELDNIYVIKNGLDVNDRIVLKGIRQIHDGEKVEYEVSDGDPAGNS